VELLRSFVRFVLWLRHQVFGQRYGRLVLEWVEDVPVVVLPGVFNPVLLRTGEILAREVARRYRHRGGEGKRALDMGTGSGAGAVFAARAGFRVVAADINPDAVRCARINALMNRVESLVDVREGDLFASVAADRFDLVTFNPPFFHGEPKDAQDRAWRSTDVMERFAAGLRGHLTRDGEALIVFSSDGEEEAMLDALRSAGFEPEIATRKDLWNEVVTVYRVGAS
jgi:HemK-related putative methylase